jgi:NTP pyrophosphatase (non-canonical NTP hydrolase)
MNKETPMTESPRQERAAPQPVALTFDAFRMANKARCIKWHPAGIDSWSPSDWLTAVTGELGELASLLKMRNRERDGLPGNKFSPTDKQVADELADVLTYLDLLAEVLGVDLGRAAVAKFNEVSERVGFPDRLPLYAARINAAQEGVPSDERAAFEKWGLDYFNYGFKIERGEDGEYLHDGTDTAWCAWQARAALSSPQGEGAAIASLRRLVVQFDAYRLGWLDGPDKWRDRIGLLDDLAAARAALSNKETP